jgi:hypothetical protein
VIWASQTVKAALGANLRGIVSRRRDREGGFLGTAI